MKNPSGSSSSRVIKLGGSLLGNSKTPQRILKWLESESPKLRESKCWRNHWIVGGGELVNTIREWDAKFSLDPKLTHRTSIEAMSVNSRLVSAWFPQWPITQPDRPSLKSTNQIVLVSSWLRKSNPELPKSWATTSDTIAVSLADYLRADELVLLKSCDPPNPLCLTELANSDFVDQQFGLQIGSLKKKTNIRFVNLNGERFSESSLRQ